MTSRAQSLPFQTIQSRDEGTEFDVNEFEEEVLVIEFIDSGIGISAVWLV
jgi:hypothetical protein